MPRFQQRILIHLTGVRITSTNFYPSHGCQDCINQFLPTSISWMSGLHQPVLTHLAEAKIPTTPILTHLTDAKIPTTNFYPSHRCQDSNVQPVLTHLTDVRIPTTNYYPSHGCQDSNNQFLPISRISYTPYSLLFSLGNNFFTVVGGLGVKLNREPV